MHKTTQKEALKRIETMSTLEAVAYANRLSNRLKCDDCSDEERLNGLELLGLLSERVQFLKNHAGATDIVPNRVELF